MKTTLDLLALALLSPLAALHAKDEPRPNIVFIVADDLNTEVGFMGDAHARTPNLDRLAAQSTVFTNAQCQAPICGPSRNSFLTGKYPHHTGLYGLDPLFRDVPELAGLVALPEYFRQNRYYSAVVGKIYHAKIDPRSFDNQNPGWFGGYGPFPDKPFNLVLKETKYFDWPGLKEIKFFDWGPYLKEQETSDYKVAQYACRQIQEATRKNTPFLLAVGFFRPHVPLYAPKEWFDLHPLDAVEPVPDQSDDLNDVPPYALKLVNYNEQQRFNRWLHQKNLTAQYLQAYRASVSFSDHCIGMVLDELKKSGLESNTIVVVLGDQGVQNGQKNLWYKRTLWEKTAHVPLLIKTPGQIRQRSVKTPVGLIDLYPTLCELAGLTVPDGLDGLSLAGLIEGRPGAENRPPALTEHGPGNVSMRSERWRYTRYADGSQELYDHNSDSEERHNLASNPEYSPVIEQFQQFLPKTWKPFAPGCEGVWSEAFPGK